LHVIYRVADSSLRRRITLASLLVITHHVSKLNAIVYSDVPFNPLISILKSLQLRD
jgi:hypothetical protein